MFTKCSACGTRILAGGVPFLKWRFCNEQCCKTFKAALADRILPEETVQAQVDAAFNAPCPQCGQISGNDIFSSTQVSGFLIAYQIESFPVVCCASCGRKNRLRAALHCLLAGWWSPRAAFFNIFILPTNLIACLFARRPEEPSQPLLVQVKSALIDSVQHKLADSVYADDNPQ